MKKTNWKELFKSLGILILAVLWRIFLYVIFTTDKALMLWNTSPKVSFRKWASGPITKKISPKWAGGVVYENNLMQNSFIRVITFLIVWMLIKIF